MKERDAEKDLEVCEAATQGPWELDGSGTVKCATLEWGKDTIAECYYEGDDDFIAMAREATPHWICRAQEAEKRLEQARAEAEVMREALEYYYETLKEDEYGDGGHFDSGEKARQALSASEVQP